MPTKRKLSPMPTKPPAKPAPKPLKPKPFKGLRTYDIEKRGPTMGPNIFVRKKSP